MSRAKGRKSAKLESANIATYNHPWFFQGHSTAAEERLQVAFAHVVRSNAIDFGIDQADFDSEDEFEYALGEAVSTLSRYHQVVKILNRYLGSWETLKLVSKDEETKACVDPAVPDCPAIWDAFNSVTRLTVLLNFYRPNTYDLKKLASLPYSELPEQIQDDLLRLKWRI